MDAETIVDILSRLQVTWNQQRRLEVLIEEVQRWSGEEYADYLADRGSGEFREIYY